MKAMQPHLLRIFGRGVRRWIRSPRTAIGAIGEKCRSGILYACLNQISIARQMDLFRAKELACQLIRDHDLENWTFRFDHAVRRFGACSWRRKEITLSRKIVALSGESE